MQDPFVMDERILVGDGLDDDFAGVGAVGLRGYSQLCEHTGLAYQQGVDVGDILEVLAVDGKDVVALTYADAGLSER